MPSLTSAFVSALLLASSASAVALPRSNDKNKRASDPAFTIPDLQLNSVVSCVGGIENAKNPFLWVPGTWANASMATDPGWTAFLGKEGLGYDVCYVAPPPYMTADIQDTLEYIVNAVHKIYDSAQITFPIIGHSQAGLAINAALTYYPSIRKELSQYISLAGSLHGTTAVAVVAQADLTTTVRDPAVWQQGYTSNWVQTLRKKGGWYNWIPTTTIFSAVDMTVMPQFNNSLAGSATYVGGKFTGNILVQESCPNSTVGHNDFLVANFGYQVVKLAVASAKKYVTTSEVKQAVANGTIDCSTFYGPIVNVATYNTTLALVNGFASGNPRVIAQVHAEPLLRPYVYKAKDQEVHDS